MATHRKWTPEEKMAVVLEGLKGRPVAEICREYGISDVQFYKWRDEALSAMHEGLKDKRTKEVRGKSWEVERERMLKKIGEQQLIIDMQKKNFQHTLSVAEKRSRVQSLIENDRLPQALACRIMMLERSSFNYKPTERDRRLKPLDPELVEKLCSDLSAYEHTYGYRKVTHKFKVYNHKKILRHMQRLRMTQPRRLKKFKHRRLSISCPIASNVRWEADLTYVWDSVEQGYLFAVIDSHDKELIGDYFGLRCRAEEAIAALEDAVRTRFGSLEPVDPGVVRVTMRVDQGSQYVSGKFRRRARELGVKLEYCGINCPDDKPYIESFFSRYKCEEVFRNDYRNYTDALGGWIAYKNWYNKERIHQGLAWMTIPEFKHSKCLQIAGTF